MDEDSKFDPKKVTLARVRRRRGAGFKAKPVPKMSQEMKDLILIILRATYQNTKQVRELKGCIITTVKVDDTDPLVDAIESENRNYARMIRQEGENRGKGPPQPLAQPWQ